MQKDVTHVAHETVLILPCTCLHTSRREHWSPYDVPKIPEHVQTRNHIPLQTKAEKQAMTHMDQQCPSPAEPHTLTLVIHEAPAKLLKGSAVAHCPERAVELVVGHHQVLRVPSHVDHLEESRNSGQCVTLLQTCRSLLSDMSEV